MSLTARNLRGRGFAFLFTLTPQGYTTPSRDGRSATLLLTLKDWWADCEEETTLNFSASPTPCPVAPSSPHSGPRTPPRSPSPSPTPSPTGPRRSSSALSSALLHPDHARLSLADARTRLLRCTSPTDTHASNDDVSLSGDFPPFHCSMAVSNSSSTASSLNSATDRSCGGGHGRGGGRGGGGGGRTSDPWLMPGSDSDHRRRSSTMTARFSLLDALDLDYALRAAAARGSVGPCSWSESLHKLTFTQSLAFPALARGRGLAGSGKRPSSVRRPQEGSDTGLNAFAKVVTALVLVLVSVLVFLVVYKFVRT
ncbi:DNA-directed RNA polymerase II subunit RPB1 [Frankliniella fusca]|uniref:DNA-directed RNA polymerase II subunit RPB1 n=1 Tax=Frankliniella fusca TaxID=407009 RepID=A0AAE1H9T6_9NEOP|nr:DNA-directed RNA polymerase II subunit RPB1 [Frankliniella fusca]